MKVLMVGAGALGSYLGHILSATCDVTLVARGEHAAAMRSGGLTLRDGRRSSEIRPRVVSKPVKGEWDHVIITTKAYDLEPALASVLKVLNEDTALVLFQNGLGLEETALRVLKAAKKENPLVRGLTSHGFALGPPGVVIHTGLGRTMLGPYRGKADLRVLCGALTEGGMEAHAVKDIRRETWIKTVVNASINPLAAAAGVSNGRLLRDAELRETMHQVCMEAARVASEEVSVSSGPLWNRVVEVAELTAGNRCSMLQDLDHDRRTEIEHLNGEIVRRADNYGFPVPVNRALTAMIKARSAYNQSGIN